MSEFIEALKRLPDKAIDNALSFPVENWMKATDAINAWIYDEKG